MFNHSLSILDRVANCLRVYRGTRALADWLSRKYRTGPYSYGRVPLGTQLLGHFFRQKLGVLFQVGVFVLGREPFHTGRADHDLYRLVDASKDVFLNVRDTVSGTDGAYERSRLLVTEHGQIRPQVVFNLVIQKSVQKVDQIRAHLKVDRGQDLSEEETTGKGTTAVPEAVHVVARVVRDDGNEPVNVGEDFGQDQVGDGGPVERGGVGQRQIVTERQVGQWQEEKVNDQVGSKDHAKELRGGIKGIVTLQDGSNGDGVGRVHVRRQRLALLTPLREFEFLVRVGGVVEPLPRGHGESHNEVLGGEGNRSLTQIHEVILDKVGIVNLGKLVVMTVVVFDVPRFGHHPIEPIAEAIPERSNSELEAVPTFLVGVDAIVASVTHVVRNHGPARESPGRERHDGNGIDDVSHGEESNGRTQIAPTHHLVQVLHVGVALLRPQLFPQITNVPRKGVDVESLDPGLVRRQFFRTTRRWRRRFTDVARVTVVRVTGTTHGIRYVNCTVTSGGMCSIQRQCDDF